jgi:2-oxoglutarate ferredoxin oxidoreductase subunit beta
MLIRLEHGQPIRFGAEKERGVVMNAQGHAQIVDVASVGEDAILVHDEAREDPALAFALARLATSVHVPTPIGVFRDVQRPEYAEETQRQLAVAQERSGPGDLKKLLHSGATWTVE